jgi:DNA-directed RNA polymerase specialized sigma24 family protein
MLLPVEIMMLIPEPELSPDLEWMLTSHQVSPHLILQAARQEYGGLLLRMAHAYLDDLTLARQILEAALSEAVDKRHQYRASLGARAWFIQRTLVVCRKMAPGLTFQRAWKATLPWLAKGSTSQTLPTNAAEADLWLAVDGLPGRSRTVYLLHAIGQLPPDEIGQILNLEEAKIRQVIRSVHAMLSKRLIRLVEPGVDLLAWSVGALRQRWPESDFLTPPTTTPKASLPVTATRRPGYWVNAALFLLMVGGIAALGGYLTSLDTQEAPVERVVQTVLVTRLALETRIISPTPTPSPAPLSLGSDAESVFRHVQNAPDSGWETFFLDAIWYDYGPNGYYGPPRATRSQIWYSNIGEEGSRYMALVGEVDQEPQYGVQFEHNVVYEIDFKTGLSYTYPEGPFDGWMNMPPEYRKELSEQRNLRHGSRILSILLGYELAETYPYFVINNMGKAANRHALVIQSKPAQSPFPQRWWVETQYGLVLRWQKFEPSDPAIILQELYPLSFVPNIPFPKDMLSSTVYWRKQTTWQSAAVPDLELASPPDWRISRLRDFPIPDEPEQDFAHGKLTFEALGEQTRVWVNRSYALGELPIQEPLDLVCKRSPDGRKIAFIQPTPGPDGILYSMTAPSWVDLSQPGLVLHQALPNAILASSDFAFSPDSSKLAFWGCGGNESNCGIYIHDLATQKNVKLISIKDGATYMIWSPAGSWLSFVGSSPNLRYDSSLVAVDTENGQIIYEGEFSWPNLQLPQDAPSWIWLATYPPPRYRLEGCAGWPKP